MKPERCAWFGVVVAFLTFYAQVGVTPGPGPGPGPGPAPTPGVKHVVIIREASEPTAAQARLITELRAGVSAKYLADKGHKLEILDEQSPAPIVAKLKGEAVPPPALFILSGETVEFKQTLPADVTGANVIETIRQHGG